MNNSIITLLSGLGTRDPSVAVAKAILMQYAPGAAVVDISHNIAPYDLQQAAYLLSSAYRHFPKGTFHVLPIDVYSGHPPRMLLAEKDGYFFIAPDNGVLPLAFGTELENTFLCAEISKPFFFKDWLHHAGRTIETLRSGKTAPFKPYTLSNPARMLQPKATHDAIDCNVLYTDRYENVVLDITRMQFEELVNSKPFCIKLMRMDDITTISKNYNDVPEGKPLCRFNDAGFLEIAFNHAKAATLLGFSENTTSNLRYHSIKIFFTPVTSPIVF